MHIFKAALAALILLAPWSAAAAQEICGAKTHQRFGETRAYFRDVLAACRPDGFCSAVSAIADPAGQAAYRAQLRIARPQAGAPHQVEFTAVDPMPTVGPLGSITLRIGRAAFDFGDRDLEESGAVNSWTVADQAAADAIVAAARTGRWASMGYLMDSDKETIATVRFSLRGMTAALAWIDCAGAARP